MYTSPCENICFSVDKLGIATIALNRPEKLNALTIEMERGLGDLFELCSQDEQIRVVILTGEGKHFCAGGDIKKFKTRIDSGEDMPTQGIRYMARVSREIRRCKKPVIAKVNGAASGAGCALAFACDFRVLESRSKCSAGFTSLGFSGDTNGWYHLSRMVGMAKTTEFYMLAETWNAEKALELGVANYVADNGDLDRVAYDLAKKLANSPTLALGYQKKMFQLLAYPDLDLLGELEEAYMPACARSQDHAEAVNAFLEKRPPQFTGK